MLLNTSNLRQGCTNIHVKYASKLIKTCDELFSSNFTRFTEKRNIEAKLDA
jgi:hypothetical protein